jgi:CBS domain-containing protein
MGEHEVTTVHDPDAIRAFTRLVLRDIRALERIIGEGRIERGVRRMGAEQEFFLVNRCWRPAPIGPDLLPELPDCFTTEIGRFNLEANLPALRVEPGLLPDLERRLHEIVDQLGVHAARHDAAVVLTGILPSLDRADVTLANITAEPRYRALNDAVMRQRDGVVRLHIGGTDELLIEHDSVMLEACNTSLQLHLQLSAEEFPAGYNMAQAISAPVLAAAVNSPLLLGKRLWAETRIALFQQSVDERTASPHHRERPARVRFGEAWLRDSVLELFHEDITRFRVLITTQVDEDPFGILDDGGVPKLRALQVFNSTIYRWNRPCYGITDGQPHLRIECRYIPAGPSVIDEVANTALWLGLMIGGVEEYGDISALMDFDDARANFAAAARLGLNASLTWVGGERLPAAELILTRLLPIAHRGLRHAGLTAEECDRYLGIVEARVRTGTTGAAWLLRSAAGLRGLGTQTERLAALTAATAARQRTRRPVHEWELARLEEAGGWRENYIRVEQFMTTDLYTVREDELVDLAAFVMDKQHIRQILVEDEAHRLIGIISYRSLLRFLANGNGPDLARPIPVHEIMERDVLCVAPETLTIDAIRLLRDRGLSALPVVQNGKLVGIVSERDFMPIAAELLKEKMQEA